MDCSIGGDCQCDGFCNTTTLITASLEIFILFSFKLHETDHHIHACLIIYTQIQHYHQQYSSNPH